MYMTIISLATLCNLESDIGFRGMKKISSVTTTLWLVVSNQFNVFQVLQLPIPTRPLLTHEGTTQPTRCY